jgi:hypothetical protein
VNSTHPSDAVRNFGDDNSPMPVGQPARELDLRLVGEPGLERDRIVAVVVRTKLHDRSPQDFDSLRRVLQPGSTDTDGHELRCP